MTRTLVLAVVLTGFSVLTFEAIATHGFVGFFETELSSLAGVQVFLDVVIALSLAIFWMQGDARERGLPFWPYALVTLCLGSIGLLSYLIHREARGRLPRRAAA